MSVSIHSFVGSPFDRTRRPCFSRTCGPLNRGSLRRAIFLLVFSILSPSCMILPMVLNSSTWLEVILINLFGVLVSYISLLHLSSSCISYQIFDYYTLVYYSFRKPWRSLIAILMILHGLFMVASFMSLFNFFVPNIYKPLNLDLDQNEEKMYTLILANLFITLPLSIFKDFENMIFTKLSNAIGVGYIIIISTYDIVFFHQDMKISWIPKSFPKSASFACIFSVYTAYYYLPTFENYLFEPNLNRVQKMLKRSLVPIGLVYLFLSVSPFNYVNTSDKYWANISEEMMILINLIVVIPTSIMTLRSIIFEVLDYEAKTMRCFLMSVGITVVACCIAIFFDRVVILFAVCGFFNVLLMVVVPVFMNPGWTRFMKYVAFVYAMTVLSLAGYGLFNSVTEEFK